MASIPIYRQQTQTDGALTPADARGVDVRSAAGDAGQNVARAVGQWGETVYNVQEQERRLLEQQREDDATAWASQSLATFRAQRTEDYIKRTETAEAGAPNFTPTILDDFDVGAKDLIAKAPTPRSKAMMELRLTDLRSSLAQDAMRFEADSRSKWRMDQAGQAIDQAAVAVLLDPTQYDAALGEQYALLGQYELHGDAMTKARGMAVGKMSAAAVTGMVRMAPRETLRALQAQDGGGYGAINALDAEQRTRFINQAQAEVNRREAEAKANAAISRAEFAERVANSSAMMLSLGTAPNAPTKAEFIAHYGPEQGAREYEDFQVVERLGADLSTVRGMSHAEQMELLATRKPTETTANFAEAQKGYESLARAVEESQRIYNDDPARYVLTYTPAVREAYAAMQETLSDPQATPAIQQAASSNFYTAMQAEQTRLGGQPANILPKQYVDAVASAFNEQATGGENSAAQVAALADQWGPKWPSVYRELAEKLPTAVVAIGSGMAPAPSALLAEETKLKPEERTKGLPEGSARAINNALTAAIDPFRAVLAPTANGGRQYTTFYQSSQMLATAYVRQGMTPEEAATRAFNEVVGDRYEFMDTYMVPRDKPVERIEAGARVTLADIPPESLAIVPGDLRGRTPEDYRAEVARGLATQGYWGNAPRDSGLQLYAPNGQPVMRADGTPYTMTWAELDQAGRGAPPSEDRRQQFMDAEAGR